MCTLFLFSSPIVIEPVVLETSRGDDLNLIAIIVGVGVGVLLVITVIIIIIIIACARSRRKKKSRKFGLDVHGKQIYMPSRLA